MKIPCRILLCVLVVFVSSIFRAYAGPAAPGPFVFQQPSGKEITLRLFGDEWFHWYETPDGRPVKKDSATGFWVYLLPSDPGTDVLSRQRVGLDEPPSPPWQKLPSEAQKNGRRVWSSYAGAKSAMKISVNSAGVGLLPVIFADFADLKHTVSSSTISNNLFGTGTDGRSMVSYYKEVSYGRFTVSAGPSGVQDWVKVPQTVAYYAPNLTPTPVDFFIPNLGPLAAQFVKDAVLAAIAAGYDFAPYALADGKVPVVNIIHAGRGEDDGGGPNAIWSHRSSISGNLGSPVTVQTPRGTITIDDYMVEPELQAIDKTHNGPSTIGVFCH